MLTRFAAVLALLGSLLVAVPAAADPVTCGPGEAWNSKTKTCVISVTTPGAPGGGSGGGGATIPIGSPVAPICSFGPEEVPCTSGDAWWNNDRMCYVSPVADVPPDDPRWADNYPDGAVYLCYNPYLGPGIAGYFFWSATAPGGPAAPPDPRVLAQQAIETMNLQAIEIGIVPEDTPGRIGVIGMPTWLWVETPTENTIGPITRSASAGGFTVTATATMTKVVWNMGDGTAVTCTGPGTPYADSYDKSPSPTCGHTYTRQGRHTVTATSYWTVAWSGIGQSGTIPLAFSNSTAITMGEVQVLTQ